MSKIMDENCSLRQILFPEEAQLSAPIEKEPDAPIVILANALRKQRQFPSDQAQHADPELLAAITDLSDEFTELVMQNLMQGRNRQRR